MGCHNDTSGIKRPEVKKEMRRFCSSPWVGVLFGNDGLDGGGETRGGEDVDAGRQRDDFAVSDGLIAGYGASGHVVDGEPGDGVTADYAQA